MGSTAHEQGHSRAATFPGCSASHATPQEASSLLLAVQLWGYGAMGGLTQPHWATVAVEGW